ncbi:sensor histidine kinase [Streptomyces johnsoniae]|uniref:histidine kinase n=1 Tax=Streptomyces johnsoniae TaxID=3075532 RepID=A0ABU2S170_9ACTN|nr:histidine kinase [Streptomyces sp. DSM 41886]MDT0442189.1 histidine kinase [Streptomyces sp. DSM 41886]
MVRALKLPRYTGARVPRHDILVAVLVSAFCALTAVVAEPDGKALDLTGWLILAGAMLPLPWFRRSPLAVLFAHACVVQPYHALDYPHLAPLLAGGLALYSVAVSGTLRRSLVLATGVPVLIAVVWMNTDTDTGVDMLRVSGWFLVPIVLGEAVRWHGQYIAAIRERAERAERTREEEAARRVAEERLRIARDLHDLLAHSITLIGVQTSVASHVLIADPERLDRTALADSLDSIAETCRDARVELRTTLQVLRGDEPDRGGHDPLPGLGGIPGLVRVAKAAGAEVKLTLDAEGPVPPVTGAAAYRIVQEALTNAVRHAGPGVSIDVSIVRRGAALRLGVVDDGPAGGVRAEAARDAEPGFGITGMRERARSIGGTLAAAPRADAPGFAVTAQLPAIAVIEELGQQA